jgi:hypothetical protein
MNNPPKNMKNMFLYVEFLGTFACVSVPDSGVGGSSFESQPSHKCFSVSLSKT